MQSAGRRRVWSFTRTARRPVLLEHSVGGVMALERLVRAWSCRAWKVMVLNAVGSHWRP